MIQKLTDTEAYADKCVFFWTQTINKANIFLGVIEYELNGLLSASHLVVVLYINSYSIRP